MYEKSPLPPSWHTSSYGAAADMSGLERSELVEHFTACQALRGRLHYLKTGADSVHGIVSARFITCVLAAVAVATGLYLAL